MTKKQIALLATLVALLVAGALWLIGVPLDKAGGFTVLTGVISALLRWRYVATRATTVEVGGHQHAHRHRRHGHHGGHHRVRCIQGVGAWWLVAVVTLGLCPRLWQMREVIRHRRPGSKAVVVVHGFSFWLHVWEAFILLAVASLLSLCFWDELEGFNQARGAYIGTMVGLVFVFAVYHAGFFQAQTNNYAVEKDGAGLTGVVYLAGRQWRVPFFKSTNLVDYQVQTTIYAFWATLKNGGRALVALFSRWQANPYIAQDDGENAFFHQGKTSVESAMRRFGSDVDALIAELDDVEYMRHRRDINLFVRCSGEVPRDEMPERDPRFLDRDEVRKPAGWSGGPITEVHEVLWFYRANRDLILSALDPRPGVQLPGEHGLGEGESEIEGLQGVEIKDMGAEGDFDPNTQVLLRGRLGGQVLKEIVDKTGLEPGQALALLEKGVAITTSGTGGASVIPILAGVPGLKGPGLTTTPVAGGH